MLATKVSCPHCHGVLKSNRPIPAGKTLQCLQCGTPFTTPAAPAVETLPNLALRHPTLADVSVAAPVAARAPAPVAVGVAPPPVRAVPVNVAAPDRGNYALTLGLLAGGLVLFLGTGIALAVYCFTAGGNTNPTDSTQAGTHKKPGESGTLLTGQTTDGNKINKLGGANQQDAKNNKPPVDPSIGVAKKPKSKVEPISFEPDDINKLEVTQAQHLSTLSPEKQKEVNEAIDKGVKFLRGSQLATGTWPMNTNGGQGPEDMGYAALPGLTLLECGVAPTDPAVQKAARFVRQNIAKLNVVHHQTYQLSLAILFLDRLGEERDRELIQAMALRLVAGQNAAGGWSYRCPNTITTAEYLQLSTFLKQHQTQPLQEMVAVNPPVDLKNPLAKDGDPLRNPVTRPLDLSLLRPVYQAGSVLPFPVLQDGKTGQPIDLVAFVDSQRSGVLVPVVVDPKKGVPTSGDPKKNKPGTDPNPKPDTARKIRPDQLPASVRNLPIVQSVVNGKAKLGAGADDNSNSQFAMMALWVARRHDVPVERTMQLVLARFHASQANDGGWGYHLRAPTKDTMTCVGLIGLAVGHGGAQEALLVNQGGPNKSLTPKALPEDKGITNGLKKLGSYLDHPAKARKGANMVNLYFLWSVERVGVLYNLKTIGNKDWYGWGVEILLNNQKSNGSWYTSSYHGSSTPIDSSMALLFLKRANLVQDLTESMRLYMPVIDPEGSSSKK